MNPTTNSFIISLVLITKEQPIRGDVLRASPPFAQSIFQAPSKDAETTRNVRNSALCSCAYTQSCCEVNTRAKTAKSVPDATTAATRVAIHSRIPGTRAGHDARGSCMRFGPTRVRFESKRRALICSSVTAPWREPARRGGAIFHAL